MLSSTFLLTLCLVVLIFVERDIETSNYNCGYVLLFFSVCASLSCSSVAWIQNYLGCLLVDWPFYHYIMPLSVPGNCLCSEVYFT
jgi:hypothetical protein